MRTAAVITVAVGVLSGLLVAQENKPVPKDSVRVFVPGCTKGFIFTAGRRTQDEPGNLVIPEGMHLRMNGPKKMMAEIKAHEGSMIQITGLMKKGQNRTDGVAIGGGVRVGPGPSGGSLSPGGGQAFGPACVAADDEVYIVIEGSGVLEIEGENVELHQGHAVFVPAGAEHRFVGYEQLSVLVILEKWRR